MSEINFILMLIISSKFMFCECENDDNSPLAELVRRSLRPLTLGCVERAGASEADLEYIRSDPPYPRNTACILKCLFEKIGLVKGGKYSKQGFLAAISPLVMASKKKLEHMRHVGETCDKEIDVNKTEKCDVSNEIVTCIYKYAPELQIKK